MTKNKVYLNNDDIIEIKVVGDQTAASVAEMGEAAKQLLAELDSRGKAGLILDDLTEMGKTDTAARQTLKQIAQSLPYYKVAMVGDAGMAMQYGTKLLLQAIGMGHKIKYFDDREEALNWLLS